MSKVSIQWKGASLTSRLSFAADISVELIKAVEIIELKENYRAS